MQLRSEDDEAFEQISKTSKRTDFTRTYIQFSGSLKVEQVRTSTEAMEGWDWRGNCLHGFLILCDTS